MIKDKFILVDGAAINTDHVVSVLPLEDGGVRIYNTLLNENDHNQPSYWEYDGELATKLIEFFQKNAREI